MGKFKVTYVRTVTEIYEAVVEADDEYEVDDVISEGKYGEDIHGEKLIESYTDDIEVTNVVEIEGTK